MELSFSMPEILNGKVVYSKVFGNYTATGKLSSYGVTLSLDELNQFREIKSREFDLLSAKIEQVLKRWAELYDKHLKMVALEATEADVAQKNEELAERFQGLDGILAHTLDVDDRVDWDALKRTDDYTVTPTKLLKGGPELDFLEFERNGHPKAYKPAQNPPEPTLAGVKKQSAIFKRLFMPGKIKAEYQARYDTWKAVCQRAQEMNSERARALQMAAQLWQDNKEQFDRIRAADNENLAELRARYNAGEAGAIEEYCDLVLANSQYPDDFPKSWILEYRPDSKMLVLEYELPSPSAVPEIESYKFVKSRNEVQEKRIADSKKKALFNSVIYQICIRTIHELFEADVVNALDTVGFNGLVTSVNPATGVSERKLIMSASADKEEFMTFDLAQVDPKATFKHLKGVAAANLMDLTPIPPIVQLEKSDRRFIEAREVIGALDDSMNLAAMPWEDFEHLVREIFEKEFASNGGEVKVTQASSDGGVDAIAFDPDPIRGGKIVIQAKRYTNTVGVAAVRDLYGTVMNEGATKGILVTTSDYGGDSYNFAKDKPITLLNGGNLLSLLEKHGHKARINIAEAKKLIDF